VKNDKLEQIGQFKSKTKIQQFCLSAKIHHQGYDDNSHESDNSFYIERAGENRMEMLGFDDEKD
jgi:hypothetical protein